MISSIGSVSPLDVYDIAMVCVIAAAHRMVQYDSACGAMLFGSMLLRFAITCVAICTIRRVFQIVSLDNRKTPQRSSTLPLTEIFLDLEEQQPMALPKESKVHFSEECIKTFPISSENTVTPRFFRNEPKRLVFPRSYEGLTFEEKARHPDFKTYLNYSEITFVPTISTPQTPMVIKKLKDEEDAWKSDVRSPLRAVDSNNLRESTVFLDDSPVPIKTDYRAARTPYPHPISKRNHYRAARTPHPSLLQKQNQLLSFKPKSALRSGASTKKVSTPPHKNADFWKRFIANQAN